MKRGVLIIFLVFSLLIIPNVNSITCSKQGITICSVNYYCTRDADRSIIESISLMGQGWCGCTISDTILPAVTITSPTTGQAFTTPTITVSGTASDTSGIAKVEVRLDEGNWELATGTTSWSKQITFQNPAQFLLQAKAYDIFNLQAKAYDTANNQKETSIAITYVPSINNPPQYISGVTTSNSNPAINTQVTLTCDFTDDKGDSFLNAKVWVGPLGESWTINPQPMQWSGADFKYSFSIPTNWAGKTIKATCNAYDNENKDAFDSKNILPWTADKNSLMTTLQSIACQESWSCSAWSACTNGAQTRTCTDSKNCGTIANKPAETQTCLPVTTCSGSWYDVAKCVCEKQNIICTVNSIWKRWGESSKYPVGLHYYYENHNDGCSSGTPGDIKEELSGCNEPCRGRFDTNGNIKMGASCGTPPSPPPPRAVCGNNICESGEDCGSCSKDCGSCCVQNFGQICNSQTNNCGQTNPGTIQCDGSCSAAIPANPSYYGQACGCGGTNDCNNNCVGSTPLITYYLDSDSDNYGSTSTTTACSKPAGYVTNSQDCNDNNVNINPGKLENTQALCSDTLDNNCNGLADCADQNCAGITKTDGKKCCTSNAQCSSNDACRGNVCTDLTSEVSSTCCYKYDVCRAKVSENQQRQAKGEKDLWPISYGECQPNTLTEDPACY